jgi:rod shape-determining protein MreD
MNAMVMVLLLLPASLAQMLLPTFAFMGQARAPMLLAVVMYYALGRELVPLLWACLAAGLLQDSLSAIPLGYSVVVFAVVGFVAGRCRDTITREHYVPHALLGATGGFVATLLLYGALRLHDGIACSFVWALLKAFWTAILGMWCVPLMCLIGGWLDRATGNVNGMGHVAEIE